jgi:glycosyltransferase involved in cell wall biosynthesis
MKQQNNHQKTNVLILAEAANPEWVSVPLIGWSLYSALRTVTNAHLVTQIRNRDAILRTGLKEGVDFTAIDSEAIARPMSKLASLIQPQKGKGWTIKAAINAISYPYFEYLVWKRFGKDIKAGRFDVVHRITPVSPTTSSSIARKCAQYNIPFVVGPLNGGVPWPKGFDSERRREREWLSYVRSAYKILPGRGKMLKASSAIIVGSRYTESEIPKSYRGKTIYLPENAIDPDRFNLTSPQSQKMPIRGCFIGRLVPYKGPDMLIEAAAPLLRSGKLVLDIIGDGPLMSSLKATIMAEGLNNAVTLHGWLDHEKVQEVAVKANLLTFPSIREFGGGVVLEAMALGIVPVIVDYAGPAELVIDGTGYKVPIGSRQQTIANFRIQLERIIANPATLVGTSKNAKAYAHSNFTWPEKARQIKQIYNWAQNHKSNKPEFFKH